MLKRLIELKVLSALLCVGALLCAPGAMAQADRVSDPLRARQLTGMQVQDSDGQKAGTVRNLVLNMTTGKLRYLVIGAGGYLGVHSTLKLVPTQAATAGTTIRQTLAISASAPKWRHAPVFKYSSLASLAEPERAEEISRYFETSSTSNAKTNETSLSTTGREFSQQASSPRPELKLASDLIGMRVVNSKQDKIGEVWDLLVSLGEPRPSFVIISTGRLFRHGHQYAVPLKALKRSDKELVLSADTTAMEQAPQFDNRAWETGGKAGGVYRYSTPAY